MTNLEFYKDEILENITDRDNDLNQSMYDCYIQHEDGIPYYEDIVEWLSKEHKGEIK